MGDEPSIMEILKSAAMVAPAAYYAYWKSIPGWIKFVMGWTTFTVFGIAVWGLMVV